MPLGCFVCYFRISSTDRSALELSTMHSHRDRDEYRSPSVAETARYQDRTDRNGAMRHPLDCVSCKGRVLLDPVCTEYSVLGYMKVSKGDEM